MTQQQLFLKAISLDPEFALTYECLASSLSKGERVTMLDGATMTQEELYSKAKTLKPILIKDLTLDDLLADFTIPPHAPKKSMKEVTRLISPIVSILEEINILK